MDYATQDNTAKAGEDYVETRDTLFIPAGTTNFIRTISVPILDDEIDEIEEEVFSLILRPSNARLYDAIIHGEFLSDGTLSIPIIIAERTVERRTPPPPVNVGGALLGAVTTSTSGGGSIMFDSSELALSEGESDTYKIRGTADPVRDMTVNLATSHPGITVNPNRLVFNQNTWQSYQTVTVTASSDAADTNERATIRHSIPESSGFVAINDAGIVSVAIAHTIVEEEETPEPEPREQAPIVQLPPTDYDLDDDGLIDVSHLAQLHALRFDLNGDGQPDKEEFADDYSQAFPSAIANMGVPADILAQGYELATNLTFDTNGDKTINEEDAFWNKGKGWPSIGSFAEPFQAVFEGNGHTIDNLFQDQSDPAVFANRPNGLFGLIGNRGQVINLGLEDVSIQGVNWVGALAGLNLGSIGVCSVTGRVEGVNGVGGLVGRNFGNIVLSVADVEVKGVLWVSDLIGIDTQRQRME